MPDLEDAPVDEESKRLTLHLQHLGERVNLSLRVIFAVVILGLVLVQIFKADAIFRDYGEGNEWDIPASTIIAFFSATVVEVIGIITVIVKYLFDTNSE